MVQRDGFLNINISTKAFLGTKNHYSKTIIHFLSFDFKVSVLTVILQGVGDVTGRTAMNYCYGHTEKFEVSQTVNTIILWYFYYFIIRLSSAYVLFSL